MTESPSAKVGGAIAAHVRRDGLVVVRSVGAKAAYRAIKALANASEYLQEDAGASPERPLAVSFSEVTVPQSARPGEPTRTVLLSEARLADLPAPGLTPQELIVSAGTNAGKAAAAIAAAMRLGPGSVWEPGPSLPDPSLRQLQRHYFL